MKKFKHAVGTKVTMREVTDAVIVGHVLPETKKHYALYQIEYTIDALRRQQPRYENEFTVDSIGQE